jgi:hypothetical protein
MFTNTANDNMLAKAVAALAMSAARFFDVKAAAIKERNSVIKETCLSVKTMCDKASAYMDDNATRRTH